MRRKTLDLILTAGGAVLTVVLIAAGALLLWGNSFSDSQVHNQLALQQVYFPTKAQLAHPTGHEVTKTMVPYLSPYAGQMVTTGTEAQLYATHFIRIHLSEMPYGGVYAKVSNASRAKPTTAALSAEVQTVFQGTTLRAMLLEAYGFSIFGELAFDGALAAFSAAGLMILLTGMGLWHIRRTPLDAEFPKSLSESSAKAA
ncbi:MAG: hypothetical protein M0Z46_07610 [Actinomycetota bacterium]|jgi:hypothetical protein|nr:hypothetical protein [Actinomycetota bacterium]